VTGRPSGARARDVRIATADAYEETLRAEGKVIASFAERRGVIVDALAKAAAGSAVIMPDALLDEVTGWSNGRSSSTARSIRAS
jgi:glycyl-tRNA synthetase beta subunit